MVVQGPDGVEAQAFGHVAHRQFFLIGLLVGLAAETGQLQRHSYFHTVLLNGLAEFVPTLDERGELRKRKKRGAGVGVAVSASVRGPATSRTLRRSSRWRFSRHGR